MHIRSASTSDLDRIMEIYARAQRFMRETGNPTQWSNVYPTRELIEGDIASRISYVVTDDAGTVQGVFVFAVGADKTYAIIRGARGKTTTPTARSTVSPPAAKSAASSAQPSTTARAASAICALTRMKTTA